MKILLMGPPASGKGTIGEMLEDKFNIPLLSLGQVLRDIPESDAAYKEINEYMDRGDLVPQNIIAEILRNETLKDEYQKGYIVDGYGRKMIDIELFDPGFDKIILLNISDETAMKRITSRRTCEKCGDVYNTVFRPPKIEGVCDECGGKLVQRDDETEEATKERLEIYHTDTKEVLDYFRGKGILLEVDAEPLPGEVFKNVIQALAQ